MSLGDEPIREQFLAAVKTLLEDLLLTPQPWGSFPVARVERSWMLGQNLGDRMRICLLDDDGSATPIPDQHDGAMDDRFAFLILIQVSGDDIDPPSRWGNRAIRAIKQALVAATEQSDGVLTLYTKLRIGTEPEAVLHWPNSRSEYQLPCTVFLPENLGAFA
jgi:hypothetical protein